MTLREKVTHEKQGECPRGPGHREQQQITSYKHKHELTALFSQESQHKDYTILRVS